MSQNSVFSILLLYLILKKLCKFKKNRNLLFVEIVESAATGYFNIWVNFLCSNDVIFFSNYNDYIYVACNMSDPNVGTDIINVHVSCTNVGHT